MGDRRGRAAQLPWRVGLGLQAGLNMGAQVLEQRPMRHHYATER